MTDHEERSGNRERLLVEVSDGEEKENVRVILVTETGRTRVTHESEARPGAFDQRKTPAHSVRT
jgi:hypothetical protein